MAHGQNEAKKKTEKESDTKARGNVHAARERWEADTITPSHINTTKETSNSQHGNNENNVRCQQPAEEWVCQLASPIQPLSQSPRGAMPSALAPILPHAPCDPSSSKIHTESNGDFIPSSRSGG